MFDSNVLMNVPDLELDYSNFNETASLFDDKGNYKGGGSGGQGGGGAGYAQAGTQFATMLAGLFGRRRQRKEQENALEKQRKHELELARLAAANKGSSGARPRYFSAKSYNTVYYVLGGIAATALIGTALYFALRR